MSQTNVAFAIAFVSMLGCSSGSGAAGGNGGTADLAAFCQKTAACGTKDVAGESFTEHECEVFLAGWIPPAGCASAVQAASCADLNLPWPNLSTSIKAICAPSCSVIEHPPACNADQTQITTCDSADGLRTFDCAGFCAGGGKTYSGTCGPSYGGQTKTQSLCWCK